MFNTLRAALADALSPLTNFRQFVVFRLSQNDDGTLDKIPVNPLTLHNGSALDSANWIDHATAINIAEQHNARIGWAGYGVGFALTQQTGLWCIDVDNCFTFDGQLSTLAREAYDYFPGAAVERSISGRGIHIWGSGALPEHANKFGDARGKLELYTSHRFIALSGQDAHGYAGNDFTAQIGAYAAHYFPPKANEGAQLVDGPCAEWAGPRDDGELIATALMAEPAQVVPHDTPLDYRPDATFGDLWTRNVEVLRRRYPPNKEGQQFDASDADLALAHKLAYWTGRDVARTERLMHMSGLVRDKWQRRRGWITETILRAARKTRAVYGEDNGAAQMSAEQRDFYMQRAHEFVQCCLRKKEEQAKERYQLKSCDDLLAMPPLQWLVRGVFPRDGIAAMYGPSGSGKSFLAIDVAIAAADPTCAEWFGHKTATVPVTYLALEGARGVGKRLQAWKQAHNKALPERLKFVDADFNLHTKPADIQDLATVLQKSGQAGGLVIIDTLSRAAHGADENSAAEMGAIISNAAKLQQLVGGLVLLVHHTGKDGTKGLRGHSSLFAALDAAVEVQRDMELGTRSWSVAKSKDDADGKRVDFELQVHGIGMDEDGPITSCVVRELGAVQNTQTAASNKRKTKAEVNPYDKLHDQAKAAFNELCALMHKEPNNTVHADHPAVHWTVYENRLREVFDGMAVPTKNRASRIERALSQLLGKGFVGQCTDAQNERYYFVHGLKHRTDSEMFSNQNLQPNQQPQPEQCSMQATET